MILVEAILEKQLAFLGSTACFCWQKLEQMLRGFSSEDVFISSPPDGCSTLNVPRYRETGRVKWILPPACSFLSEIVHDLILEDKLLDVEG